MKIDLDEETPILLSDSAKDIPGRPHLSTIYRWALRGVRGIKLETLMIGGRRYTTHAALHRFFERTTAAADRPPV